MISCIAHGIFYIWFSAYLIVSGLKRFLISSIYTLRTLLRFVLISNMTSPALLSNFSSILSIFYLVNTYAANLLLQNWSVILYKIFGYSVNKKWFILWRSKYKFFPKRIEFHVLMYRHEEKKYSIVMIIWISV